MEAIAAKPQRSVKARDAYNHSEKGRISRKKYNDKNPKYKLWIRRWILNKRIDENNFKFKATKDLFLRARIDRDMILLAEVNDKIDAII
jgi:hypothetical protein